jgi:hypothetical protein
MDSAGVCYGSSSNSDMGANQTQENLFRIQNNFTNNNNNFLAHNSSNQNLAINNNQNNFFFDGNFNENNNNNNNNVNLEANRLEEELEEFKHSVQMSMQNKRRMTKKLLEYFRTITRQSQRSRMNQSSSLNKYLYYHQIIDFFNK